MRGVWLLLSAIVFLQPATAQLTSGSISGYVYDPSGRAIPNAEVRATDESHSVSRGAITNESGFYRFLDLAPAVYTVSATARNLEDVSSPEVTLTVNSHLRVDLHLPLTGLKQALEVTASVRTLETESAELGVVLDRKRIESLPLNRRDFLQLSLLTPGVMPPAEDSELSTPGSFAMHANGGREEYNNFLLDGVDNNDPYANRYVLQPSVEAIQEFKIATNSYGAEYGRNAAAQVNVITRSGSNQMHGSVYEYLRNRVLDARNFFDGSEKPKFVRNQFGFALGGPIAKHKTFFFGNADFLRERRGLSRLGAVPTQAERRGDLSAIEKPIVDPFTRQPFPGNVIPRERFSPTAEKILDLFPLPNRSGSGANHVAQPVVRENLSQANVRVDHRFTETDQLMARYSYGFLDLFEPFSEDTDAVPGFGDLVRDAGHNAMAQYQRVISPHAVNSLRVGFGRLDRELLPENHDVDAGRLWGVDWIQPPLGGNGFPVFNVAGFSRVGDTTSIPMFRDTNTHHIADNLSLIRGSHTFKLGGEIRRLSLDGRLDLLTRGSISFSGAISGAGISDLLLGLASFSIQSQADNPITLRSTSYNLYFQDDWKMRPDLMLNLGVRYEYNTPPTDPTNGMSTIDPETGKVVRLGTGRTTRSGIRPDRNNFVPRIGFAWSPGTASVMRGGYGIYYDAGMFIVNSAQYFNPPQFNLWVFFPTGRSLLSLENPFPSGGGITPPPSLNVLSPDLTTSYMQHWCLNIQRNLGPIGVLSLAYAGSKGTRLIRSRNPNQPRPGPGPVQLRRPFPQFGSMFFVESGANSNYHSFQTVFNRPVTRSLGLWAVYTFSKSIDDSSGFLDTKPDQNFPQDSLNYRAERGVSSFDIRQRMALSFIYSLPQGHWLIRNTDFKGIVTLQSAQPFTPILRFDNSNTGNTGGVFGSDRPDLVGDPRLSNPTADRWFNTDVLSIPQRYMFGSAGRNVVRGDGSYSFDLALARRFPISERWKLQIEAQAFNLFNQTNFDLPEMFADEPATFGRIFSAKASRQLQFALRLLF